ncbi:ATP-binding protein [Thalassotalea fusca]
MTESELKIENKNQVVNRYNTSVVLIFITIVFTAIVIAVYRYQVELSTYQQRQFQELKEEAGVLNAQMQQAVTMVEGLTDFAEYYIKHPKELSASIPSLKQDGQLFFLEKEQRDFIEHRQILSVNITGIGDISQFSQEMNDELAMAKALTPAFVAAQKTIKEANWFYYLSYNRFISLYPWIGRKGWYYGDRMLSNTHMQSITEAAKKYHNVHWSQPYKDTAGKGMNVALGKGVKRNDDVAGAVIIDISLAKLHDSLRTIDNDNTGVFIIDDRGYALVHKTNQERKIQSSVSWQDVAPEGLKHLTFEQLKKSPDIRLVGNWLVLSYQLPVNNWMVVKYFSFQDFTRPIFTRFMSIFATVFIGLLTLLTVVYFMTRRTFITPTQEFISHIAYSAQGDHGKVKPPSGWEHWFYIVEDIFSQNRSLMQQLKDQNEALDIRVNEKTQALREKSEQHHRDYALLRSVMDAIPDYIIFNDGDGRLIGCNLAFERFTKQSEHKMLGSVVGNMLNNELGQALVTKNSTPTSTKSQYGVFDIVETGQSTYELFTTEFYSSDGVSLGTINIIRDVTTQYAVNVALEKAKVQAELANKAKSQFLANMSHEIRTPINAIQGMHYLIEQTPLNNLQKQHLSYAQTASVALLHLVDELLDLAKIESGNMSIVTQPVSLDKIIEQAVKLNAIQAQKKSLNIAVDIDQDVPLVVNTDEMRLVQVFTNLLNNAVKFTHQGSIQVTVTYRQISDNEQEIICKVTDTGIGIAEEKQAHLFEAFRQADESMTRQYGGSGLGLSICKQIINLLDGDISLSSSLGKGTEFTFNLPIEEYVRPEIKLPVPVAVMSYHCAVPNSVIQLVKRHWDTYQEIESLSVTVLQQGCENIVLFVDVTEVTTKLCDEVKESLMIGANKQVLLAVCQSKYSEQNDNSFNVLEQANIPYLVCDLPLFRYTLLLIQEKAVEVFTAAAQANLSSAIGSFEKEPPANKTLKGVHVLLVEDNLVNQMVASELLMSMDAKVVVAENGQQAIEKLADAAFDVVLMDIQMPVMDGLTAARKIRENKQWDIIPIVAMTAHAREEDRAESIAAGMDLHIAKPVKADVLFDTVLSITQSKKNV